MTTDKELVSQRTDDGCQCPECYFVRHDSCCAVHNEPAYPKGECDCSVPRYMKFKGGMSNKEVAELLLWLAKSTDNTFLAKAADRILRLDASLNKKLVAAAEIGRAL